MALGFGVYFLYSRRRAHAVRLAQTAPVRPAGETVTPIGG
jgi:hypothetical protein